jgi:hypothetical protein
VSAHQPSGGTCLRATRYHYARGDTPTLSGCTDGLCAPCDGCAGPPVRRGQWRGWGRRVAGRLPLRLGQGLLLAQ